MGRQSLLKILFLKERIFNYIISMYASQLRCCTELPNTITKKVNKNRYKNRSMNNNIGNLLKVVPVLYYTRRL
jgi:hypothetical protein